MIEQIGVAIKFRAAYTASGVRKTGLTVTVSVYAPDRTKLVNAVAATEVGDGIYEYILVAGSVSTEGEYTAVFMTADTTVDQKDIFAQWEVGRAGIEDLDATMTSRAAAATALTNVTWTDLKAGYLDAAISSRSSHAVTDIWNALTSGMATEGSVGKLIKDMLDATTSSRLPSASYINPPTVDAIADAVLDETVAGHTGLLATALDSTLSALATAISGVSTSLDGIKGLGWSDETLKSIYDEVLLRLLSSTYVEPDNTKIAAIKTKTDSLPNDPASNTQLLTRLAAEDYVEPDNESIAAIKAKTDTIGAGEITVVSPVSPSGLVQMIRGDVYKAEDGRAFPFIDTQDKWPDLTDATVEIRVTGNSFEADVVSPTQITLELTKEQSIKIPKGTWEYRIVVIQKDQDELTIGSGDWECS